MSQPTRRKTNTSQGRARRDSARLSTNSKKTTQRKNSSPKARRSNSSSLDSSLLWTKKPQSKNRDSSLIIRILAAIGSFFLLIISGFFKAIKTFLLFIINLISRSKVAIVLSCIAVLLLLLGLVDTTINWGKVYPGVMIGNSDVAGKTAKELESFISETYSSRLIGTTVYVFANEEASKNLEESLQQTNDASFAEQHSVEEVQANKLVWEINSSTLGASLDVANMVKDAMSFGRENGGLIQRVIGFFSGYNIDPQLKQEEEKLEALAADIDATIGNPRINYDITVSEGLASITEGHDGDMINRDTFSKELEDAFLDNPDNSVSLVAHTEYAPLQITKEEALRVSNQVNESISLGAEFFYNDSSWNAETIDLGNWIKTKVEGNNGSWMLKPYLEYDLAKNTLYDHFKASFSEDAVRVSFSVSNDTVTVSPKSQGTLPQLKNALDSLSKEFFEGTSTLSVKPTVEVGFTSIPASMSLEEALDVGVISTISEYTTEYAAGAENRNHNIHLAADLLNNSIIKANGGEWSFNETAGEATAEAGYKGAGTILDGEIVDDIGGGICQVATTVFNSVYNAGYPILQRYNHSLYIPSYPMGLDAAVSYPHLDLQWSNDTSSDILLSTSYTDSTITVTLYGVDPAYEVSTQTGEWEQGEEFKVKTTVDETMEPGTSIVKTQGSNGTKITVHRTVKDKEGNILHEKDFISVYTPRDEVVIEGPKPVEMPDDKQEEKLSDDKASDKENKNEKATEENPSESQRAEHADTST